MHTYVQDPDYTNRACAVSWHTVLMSVKVSTERHSIENTKRCELADAECDHREVNTCWDLDRHTSFWPPTMDTSKDTTVARSHSTHWAGKEAETDCVRNFWVSKSSRPPDGLPHSLTVKSWMDVVCRRRRFLENKHEWEGHNNNQWWKLH